jgi:hypothetical protein
MSKYNMKRSDKKGQVTIFIIIAIIIIIGIALVYFFYPSLKELLGSESKNPSEFMQNCIEDKINEGLKIISEQGGSIEPQHYFLYNNTKIEYLCYTGEYYQTCIMQQPMLKKHIEEEIKNYIEADVKSCFESLKKNYEKRGYSVQMKNRDFEVEILPKIIAIKFDTSIVLTKGESEIYNSIKISVRNNIYELISIANSILNWEAKYGDAETTTYMNYYHDLKVEKKKQSEGTTIYILTDRNNRNKFQFASRSVAWPPGYGTEETYQ